MILCVFWNTANLHISPSDKQFYGTREDMSDGKFCQDEGKILSVAGKYIRLAAFKDINYPDTAGLKGTARLPHGKNHGYSIQAAAYGKGDGRYRNEFEYGPSNKRTDSCPEIQCRGKGGIGS